jgi:hypothetical protein
MTIKESAAVVLYIHAEFQSLLSKQVMVMNVHRKPLPNIKYAIKSDDVILSRIFITPDRFHY